MVFVCYHMLCYRLVVSRLLKMFLYVNRPRKFLREFAYVTIHRKKHSKLSPFMYPFSRIISSLLDTRRRHNIWSTDSDNEPEPFHSRFADSTKRERIVVLVTNTRDDTDDQSTLSEASRNPKVDVLRIFSAKHQKHLRSKHFK